LSIRGDRLLDRFIVLFSFRLFPLPAHRCPDHIRRPVSPPAAPGSSPTGSSLMPPFLFVRFRGAKGSVLKYPPKDHSPLMVADPLWKLEPSPHPTILPLHREARTDTFLVPSQHLFELHHETTECSHFFSGIFSLDEVSHEIPPTRQAHLCFFWPFSYVSS